jgi:acyl carrier protein
MAPRGPKVGLTVALETRIERRGEISQMNVSDTVRESEVAALIVSVLHLEIAPQDIQPEEALFVEGLGLDSIDALELALEISKRYGIEIAADGEDTPKIFSSLRALTEFINRARRI